MGGDEDVGDGASNLCGQSTGQEARLTTDVPTEPATPAMNRATRAVAVSFALVVSETLSLTYSPWTK